MGFESESKSCSFGGGGQEIPHTSFHEKSGALVAHFKCTVLLLPSGTVRVTGLDMPDYFKTEKEPDEETKKILQEIKEEEEKKAARKAAKKKKKKAAKS